MAIPVSTFTRLGLVSARHTLASGLSPEQKAKRCGCLVEDLPVLTKAVNDWLLGATPEQVGIVSGCIYPGPATSAQPAPKPTQAVVAPNAEEAVRPLPAAQVSVLRKFNELRTEVLKVTDLLTNDVSEEELLTFLEDTHKKGEWRSTHQLAQLLTEHFQIYHEHTQKPTAPNPG